MQGAIGNESSIITLQSGATLDLLNPESSDFGIEDIAHGLAHICRYAGQCNQFYSVAEHSILVSKVLTDQPLLALMHDAAEAFIGDMPKPLKILLPSYRTIEKRIEKEIFQRFGLVDVHSSELKRADLQVMAAEQEILMPPGTNPWLKDANIHPADVEIVCMSPDQSKKTFLRRYAELRKKNEHLCNDIAPHTNEGRIANI